MIGNFKLYINHIPLYTIIIDELYKKYTVLDKNIYKLLQIKLKNVYNII